MPIILKIRGLHVVCFVYLLQVFVILDADKEGNSVIVDSKLDILNQLKEELGREIKGVTFLTPFESR
jgi:hypothetical protein